VSHVEEQCRRRAAAASGHGEAESHRREAAAAGWPGEAPHQDSHEVSATARFGQRDGGKGRAQLIATLREVTERLAAYERTPCSPGERQAAVWLAERLRAAGAREVELQEVPSWGCFQPQLTALGALQLLAGACALAGRRALALASAAIAAAGLIDEVQNGPRLLRRALRRRRSTVNVIARAGDPRAKGTLVVLAHHDAPRTGVIFDQRPQIALHRIWPERIEGIRTQPPQWWLGLASPALSVAAALSGARWVARVGLPFAGLFTAAMADMWRSPTVPGANDNLSGVAALVALAEQARQHPLKGLELLLVSCGAEETLQDGIRGFMASYRHRLDPSRTWLLNLDTVGSPHLILLEGEGPVWMEDYTGPDWRTLIAATAAARGIELERGVRARASSDTVIPSRAGFPSAMIASVTDWRVPANYHLMTDTPERLDYESLADTAELAWALAERLASGQAS
jgi:hypothetical protein